MAVLVHQRVYWFMVTDIQLEHHLENNIKQCLKEII